MGPSLLVGPCAIAVLSDEPEEEEEATVWPPEGVALEVEEHVAFVGLGQRRDAPCPLVVRIKEPERRPLVEVFAGDYLQLCLGRQLL